MQNNSQRKQPTRTVPGWYAHINIIMLYISGSHNAARRRQQWAGILRTTGDATAHLRAGKEPQALLHVAAVCAGLERRSRHRFCFLHELLRGVCRHTSCRHYSYSGPTVVDPTTTRVIEVLGGWLPPYGMMVGQTVGTHALLLSNIIGGKTNILRQNGLREGEEWSSKDSAFNSCVDNLVLLLPSLRDKKKTKSA